MNWIPVERGREHPLVMCLVCGLDEHGCRAFDFGYWDARWRLGLGGFTPLFYATIGWPPELIEHGEGLS